jgi:FkbH-like protein
MSYSEELAELNAAYLKAVAEKNIASMNSYAGSLLTLSPTLAVAQRIINSLSAGLPGRSSVEIRLAFLRSYTVEPCIPLLRALALLHGVKLTVKVGEFNSYSQEVIDPSSWLYEFSPQIVVFAVQTRDLAPGIWQYSTKLPSEDTDAVVDGVLAPLVSLISQFRSRSNASLIFQSFEQPLIENGGLLDSRRVVGQTEIIRLLNRKLNLAALAHEGVYVLDYDALVARHGREHWIDEKKWLTSRSPISADCLIHIAREYLRFVIPLAGRQSKVLVVDLDNTLWGGIVGEDGTNGLQIGLEYPGACFLAFQRAILDLHERGILLAICSKNNEADALDALANHPEMLLRPEHFAAIRINWTDKAQNIRDIAAELNVGIDSIAFADDSPAERQRVKQELPEVTVIDLPSDPARYAMALRSSPVFERLSLTSEDRDRGKYYSEQRERSQLASTAASLEDFYRSLEMRAEFVAVTSATLARIAQLTQKTNQLNTTTRRYSESEVQSLLDNPSWTLFGIRILDKFGDNGIVGVVISKIEDNILEIDTFLLSCRVIGRTVETAMLARVYEIAKAAGCTKIQGWFFPTKKNDPARGIFSNHGFTVARETNSGTLWELNPDAKTLARPAWIA